MAKKNLHPTDYRFVVFQDISSDFSFLGRSTAPSEDTTTWEDGKEYPLIKLHLSSASHPFYTGKKTYVDSAGRIEKFNKRFS